MAGPTKLTPKQARFVQEYLIDLNAAQAAIRAGYSAKTARVIGHENLTKPDIAAAIEKARAAHAERAELSADWVIDELRKIAAANMADYVGTEFSALTREQTAAVSEVTIEDFVEGSGEQARTGRRVRLKLYDKRAALVDLGRHLGFFEMRKQQQQDITIGINVEDVRDKILRTLARLAAARGSTSSAQAIELRGITAPTE